MNINKFIGAFSAAALVGALGSCSSDYLDLAPETSISTNDITATVEAAQLAVNGICMAMQTQYQSTEWNQFNGEAYLNTIFNEAFGQDDLTGLGLRWWGTELTVGQTYWNVNTTVLNLAPWMYCYNLISQANQILAGIDQASGSEAQRAFVKAETLTLRAHAYTKLMQYFAPRWEDSNNGEFMCAVWRVDPGIEDAPLASMNQIFGLIYQDLNTAIDLYKEGQAGGFDREKKWQPNLSVAYGIFARAAMIIHDYPKAQEMAKNAQAGYTMMDNNTYLAGFCYDNNDLMWTESEDPADIYYWSWGSHHSVNGSYTESWGLGAGAIDYELYKSMDPNDIRRQCFLTPDKIAFLQGVNRAWNPGKVTEDDFWCSSLVNESSNCNLAAGPYARKDAGEDGKWGLYNIAIRYAWYYGENIFTGNFASMANEGYWAYYKIENNGKVLLTANSSGTLVATPFGAQFKFWSQPPYGTSAYPFMRSTEMLLTEAEAAYWNGDITTVTTNLNKLNKVRIPGYQLTATGEDLLEEIIKSRRLELWGEGFSWPDFKRWNRPIVRKAWVENDPTSGNWMPDYAKETPADANKGWRIMIPRSEVERNKAVDQSLIK